MNPTQTEIKLIQNAIMTVTEEFSDTSSDRSFSQELRSASSKWTGKAVFQHIVTSPLRYKAAKTKKKAKDVLKKMTANKELKGAKAGDPKFDFDQSTALVKIDTCFEKEGKLIENVPMEQSTPTSLALSLTPVKKIKMALHFGLSTNESLQTNKGLTETCKPSKTAITTEIANPTPTAITTQIAKPITTAITTQTTKPTPTVNINENTESTSSQVAHTASKFTRSATEIANAYLANAASIPSDSESDSDSDSSDDDTGTFTTAMGTMRGLVDKLQSSKSKSSSVQSLFEDDEPNVIPEPVEELTCKTPSIPTNEPKHVHQTKSYYDASNSIVDTVNLCPEAADAMKDLFPNNIIKDDMHFLGGYEFEIDLLSESEGSIQGKEDEVKELLSSPDTSIHANSPVQGALKELKELTPEAVFFKTYKNGYEFKDSDNDPEVNEQTQEIIKEDMDYHSICNGVVETKSQRALLKQIDPEYYASMEDVFERFPTKEEIEEQKNKVNIEIEGEKEAQESVFSPLVVDAQDVANELKQEYENTNVDVLSHGNTDNSHDNIDINSESLIEIDRREPIAIDSEALAINCEALAINSQAPIEILESEYEYVHSVKDEVDDTEAYRKQQIQELEEIMEIANPVGNMRSYIRDIFDALGGDILELEDLSYNACVRRIATLAFQSSENIAKLKGGLTTVLQELKTLKASSSTTKLRLSEVNSNYKEMVVINNELGEQNLDLKKEIDELVLFHDDVVNELKTELEALKGQSSNIIGESTEQAIQKSSETLAYLKRTADISLAATDACFDYAKETKSYLAQMIEDSASISIGHSELLNTHGNILYRELSKIENNMKKMREQAEIITQCAAKMGNSEESEDHNKLLQDTFTLSANNSVMLKEQGDFLKVQLERYDEQSLKMNEQSLMMAEHIKKIDNQASQLEENSKRMETQQSLISEQQTLLDSQEKMIRNMEKESEIQKAKFDQLSKQLDQQCLQLEQQAKQLTLQTGVIETQSQQLEDRNKFINSQATQLTEQTMSAVLQTKNLEEQTEKVAQQTQEIKKLQQVLSERNQECRVQATVIDDQTKMLYTQGKKLSSHLKLSDELNHWKAKCEEATALLQKQKTENTKLITEKETTLKNIVVKGIPEGVESSQHKLAAQRFSDTCSEPAMLPGTEVIGEKLRVAGRLGGFTKMNGHNLIEENRNLKKQVEVLEGNYLKTMTKTRNLQEEIVSIRKELQDIEVMRTERDLLVTEKNKLNNQVSQLKMDLKVAEGEVRRLSAVIVDYEQLSFFWKLYREKIYNLFKTMFRKWETDNDHDMNKLILTFLVGLELYTIQNIPTEESIEELDEFYANVLKPVLIANARRYGLMLRQNTFATERLKVMNDITDTLESENSRLKSASGMTSVTTLDPSNM